MSYDEISKPPLLLLQTNLDASSMSKKNIHNYSGELKKLPSTKVYLNVNYLEKGQYELHIIHKNKLIKKTTFKK